MQQVADEVTAYFRREEEEREGGEREGRRRGERERAREGGRGRENYCPDRVSNTEQRSNYT